MKILIFDTETGGLNPYRNDILQLSFQVIDGDTFNTLLVAGINSVANFPIPKLSYFNPNASLARFKVSDVTTRAFSAPSSRILFNTSGFLNFS